MKRLRIVPLGLLLASGLLFADEGGKKEQPANSSAAEAHAATAERQQSFVPGGVAPSFVIPKNTCESGSSLQKLMTGKPAKPNAKPNNKSKRAPNTK
jgi:hypothetical protein